MTIITRTAIEADLPILKIFEQGIIVAERPYDDTLKADPISYYDIRALIRSKDAEVAVAQVDGQLVASGYIQKRASLDFVVSEFHGYIGFLYVSPDFRRQGLNTHILNHLFDWAKANNLPEVHLAVYPENAPAVKAYRKAGFQPHLLEMRLNLDNGKPC